MIKRLSIFLLLALACASGSDWTGARSEHIALFSDKADNAEAILQRLENARAALGSLGLPLAQYSKQITVILASKQAVVRNAWPANAGDTGTLGGLTYDFEDHVFVLVDMSRPNSERNLLHEYVHALVGESFTRVPRWIDEGIAEHYSTLLIDGSRSSLGPLDARRRWAQNSCPKSGSLQEILSVDPNSFISAHGSGAFYLPAATVVRYLVEQFGIQKVYKVIGSINAGDSSEKALRDAYGLSVEDIESAASNSCKLSTALKENAQFTPQQVRSSRIANGDREFQFVYADILSRTAGRQDVAIKMLQPILDSNTNDPFAQRGIGVALTYKGDFDHAVSFLQAAFAQLPDDPTTLYHLIIACTNSLNCDANQYGNEVKRLVAVRPNLGQIKDWNAQMEKFAAENSDEDSGFLPDEKPEPAAPPKKK